MHRSARYDLRMEHDEQAARYVAAVVDQLNAEIKAAGYSEKTFAARLGINYGVYRRYLNGERRLPLLVLWASVAALDLSQTGFIDRVQNRYEGR